MNLTDLLFVLQAELDESWGALSIPLSVMSKSRDILIWSVKVVFVLILIQQDRVLTISWLIQINFLVDTLIKYILGCGLHTACILSKKLCVSVEPQIQIWCWNHGPATVFTLLGQGIDTRSCVHNLDNVLNFVFSLILFLNQCKGWKVFSLLSSGLHPCYLLRA